MKMGKVDLRSGASHVVMRVGTEDSSCHGTFDSLGNLVEWAGHHKIAKCSAGDIVKMGGKAELAFRQYSGNSEWNFGDPFKSGAEQLAEKLQGHRYFDCATMHRKIETIDVDVLHLRKHVKILHTAFSLAFDPPKEVQSPRFISIFSVAEEMISHGKVPLLRCATKLSRTEKHEEMLAVVGGGIIDVELSEYVSSPEEIMCMIMQSVNMLTMELQKASWDASKKLHDEFGFISRWMVDPKGSSWEARRKMLQE